MAVQIDCDVLVIGAGAAGCRAAYEAKKLHPELDVLVAVAGRYGSSGSSAFVASESLGINAPFNNMADGDDPDVYYQDIVRTGGGLSNPKLCRILADESCARLEELIKWGVNFDRDHSGRIIQKKLSGCTKARSLTCGGRTGVEIVRALKNAGEKIGVKALEGVRVVELIRNDCGEVCGAAGLMGAEAVLFEARSVLLATGGAGRIFQRNINPSTLEGDGWAMAYESGAKFVNMEFFQIGPNVVYPKINFIIHSHMWHFHPKLLNGSGEEFVSRYCPEGISAEDVIDAKAMSYPFSVRTVAKYLDLSIFKEIQNGGAAEHGGILFDVTHIDRERFLKEAPITYETLRKAGVDLTKDAFELGLAVQNFNGGILIDENGFTGVPGLFAAGEVTGGVHGADRPGGNNLTDTQVFGYRAGRAAAEYAAETGRKKGPGCSFEGMRYRAPDENENEILKSASELYYRKMTIVRDAQGIQDVLDFIEENADKGNSLVLRNRLLVGKILALAISARKESRGTHYREDFPDTDRSWDRRILLGKGKNGGTDLSFD